MELVFFPSHEAWEAWLEEHHASVDGVRMKIAKKGSGIASVTHADALESALCFGWIDARRNSLDDDHFIQTFVPRRPRSRWSKVNRAKAEQLIAAGRMRPAGLREVERARTDGRWEAAYDSAATIRVPADLQAELDADPSAQAFFDALNSQNRYAILYRLQDARRPETRVRRLEKFVAMLKAGERLYP